MSNKEKSGNISMIITIAVALLAIAAIVILLVSGNGDKEPEEPVISGFGVTQALADECIGAAQKLVGDNYEIIRLYITEGLPHKMVYGNEAEALGGYYQADSAKYKEFEQIDALVRSVYSESEADRILQRLEVNTVDGTSEELEVYKHCKINGAAFFGINERFDADPDYKVDWSSCYVEVEPHSETECEVTVYLDGVTSDTAAEHAESVRNVSMVKSEDNSWRLTEFLK